jgi:hypothetical protein
LTGKSAFTPEEWARLLRAPFVTGMAITVAELGGSIDAMKESMATLTTTTKIARSGGHGELVDELARSIAIEISGGKELADFQPDIKTTADQMLAELRAVNGIVRAKATPQEADAFRSWLFETASRTAQAAKEGGFLGIGSKRIGKREQEMLDALRAALA